LPRRGSGCGISRRWHHTVQGANSSEAGCGIWHEDPRHRSQAGGRILHQIPLQGHHSIISLPLSSIISTLHHLPSIRGEMQILLCMPTRSTSTIYFTQAVFNLSLQILIVLSIINYKDYIICILVYPPLPPHTTRACIHQSSQDCSP
jgi:hypothetical protein